MKFKIPLNALSLCLTLVATAMLVSAKPARAEESPTLLPPAVEKQSIPNKPAVVPSAVPPLEQSLVPITVPPETFIVQTPEGTVTCPAKKTHSGFSLLIIGFNSAQTSNQPGEGCEKFVQFLQDETTIAGISRAIAGLPADDRAAYQRVIAGYLMKTRFGMPQSQIVEVQVRIDSLDSFWYWSDQEVIRRVRKGLIENGARLRRMNRIERQHPGAFQVPIPTDQDVDKRLNQAQKEREIAHNQAQEAWDAVIKQMQLNSPATTPAKP